MQNSLYEPDENVFGGALGSIVGTATKAAGSAVEGALKTASETATTAIKESLPLDPAKMYLDPSTIALGATQMVGGLPDIGDPTSMMKTGFAAT